MNIQLFSAQRSGSNYIMRLLELNFDLNLLINSPTRPRPKAQHAPCDPDDLLRDQIYGVVICVKDPYAWVDSMIRWRNACSMNWLGKDQYTWPRRDVPDPAHVQREGLPDEQLGDIYYFIEDQCLIWNACYSSWLQTVKRAAIPTFIMRYEDTIADAPEVLKRVRNQLNLNQKLDPFQDITQRVGPGKGFVAEPMVRAYFTEKQYLEALGTLVPEITKLINWDIAHGYGYDPA